MNESRAFKPIRDLPPGARLQAARLVQSALPAYYKPLDPARADALVCAEFAADGTELEHCDAILEGDDVRGIICTYGMEELAERQYNSFQAVARILRRDEFALFADNLRQLRADLPEIHGHGKYLAFIAVDPRDRGSGLADSLMGRAIETAAAEPLYLTVRNDNDRARAFYNRHDFALAAKGPGFSLLQRVPANLGASRRA